MILRLLQLRPTKFQSTLPRRERQDVIFLRTNSTEFQSTLPRRERQNNKIQKRARAHFNPRSREGSDRNQYRKGMHAAISIHAPAKGATNQLHHVPGDTERFQSTLPRRERRENLHNCRKDNLFQSTLPRRERLRYNKISIMYNPNFNPRSREGSDI